MKRKEREAHSEKIKARTACDGKFQVKFSPGNKLWPGYSYVSDHDA